MKEVQDPALLQQLEGGTTGQPSGGLKPVEDPGLIQQLESKPETPADDVLGPAGQAGAYLTYKAGRMMNDPLGEIDSSVRMLASGATFGYADEIAAGMNALLGIGEGETVGQRYESNLQKEMARDESIRAADPAGSMAQEVAGGFTTAVPGAGYVMNAPRLANVPAWAKAMGIGATGGALAGAGSAKPGERTEGAVYGGLLGGALGVGLSLTKTGVSAAIRRYMQGRGGKDTRVAASKILQALQRDELTPEEAFARVSDLGPEARLIDVGDNTRSLGRAVAGQPGRAKKVATEFLNTRQEGQGSRVMDAVNRALDPTGDFAGTMDDLQRLRSTAARPLYEAAYAKPVKPNESLISLFRRPAMERAWRKAADIARTDGATVADDLFITRPDGGKVVNPEAIKDVQTLDYIKRGLDDLIQPHVNEMTGKITTNQGRALDNLRKEFIRVLDNLSPEYKAARSAASGPIRSMEMAERGRRFIRGDEDVLARQIANMTDDEKLFFRMGAARALRDTVYNTPDGADTVKRIFGSELKRNRLRQLFPDQESFDDFRRVMQQESELFTTRAIASPRSGSQTDLRKEEVADLARDAGEGLAELAKGNTGSAAHRFLRGLFGKGADKIPPEQSEAIAKMLFTNDPETNRQIVRALSFQRTLENLDTISGMASAEGGRQIGTAVAR